jgi:hypothetical protein
MLEKDRTKYHHIRLESAYGLELELGPISTAEKANDLAEKLNSLLIRPDTYSFVSAYDYLSTQPPIDQSQLKFEFLP